MKPYSLIWLSSVKRAYLSRLSIFVSSPMSTLFSVLFVFQVRLVGDTAF
jgi:hypothetical protein